MTPYPSTVASSQFLLTEPKPQGLRRVLPPLASLWAILVGTGTLIGWLFDIPQLMYWGPSLTTIKFNSGICILALGMAWGLQQLNHQRERPLRTLHWGAEVLAGLVALVGLLTIVQYATGVDLGLDQLVVRDVFTPSGKGHPGRMGLNSALTFFCLGLALLLGDRETGKGNRPSQVFALLALFTTATALIGYGYGVSSLYRIGQATPMALPTTATLGLFSFAFLAASPARGLMATIAGPRVGSVTLRRLLPPIVIAPTLLGMVLLRMQTAGVFSEDFAFAGLTTLLLIIFSTLFWSTARSMNQSDTEREQAEEALRQAHSLLEARVRERTADLRLWQQIFEHASWGVTVTDPRTNQLLAVNPAFAAMHGYEPEELAGISMKQLIPPEALKDYPSIEQVLNAGGHLVYEVLHIRKDGNLFPCLTEVTAVRDDSGQVIYRAANVQDITERTQAEAEIRQLNEQLEQRVRDRTSQLQAVNKELESFAYSVSHDLRAPLRAVDGFSQAVLEEYGEKLDEQGKLYLNRARQGARRMAQLIDELLNLSRVTRSELRREPVDLSGIVRKIAGALKEAEPERKAEFIIAERVQAQGDLTLLRVVMENLVGNAWKFTSKSPQARIEFGVQERKGQKVYFVSDNGAGFDMQYSDKLFGAFQRLHAASEFDGNGIGLATVQRIIHRHGGWIEAEGQVGQGATFYFTLNGSVERSPR